MRVIVPSAAWVTSIAPAIQLGFESIMCKADRRTWALDLGHLRELLDEHDPSIVVLVQVLGVPHDMDSLMKLREDYNFFLLEDSCAAMGSSYHGKKVGTFGDMATMSTYFGHQFSTVEGGLISTDNKYFNDLLLMLRSHGWIAHLDPEARAERLKQHGIEDMGTNFVFCEPGFNLRLDDMRAFIGLRQLDRMDWLAQRRFENHKLYKQILGRDFLTQTYDEDTTVCSIHFCALADSFNERRAIMEALEINSIETRPFTSGNQGLQPYWFTRYGKFNNQMATWLYDCGFFLPNNTSLTEDDIRFISSVVIETSKIFRQGGVEYA